MEDPRLWFEESIVSYERKIRENPLFTDYTDEQVRNRAIGSTYHNWYLRLRRRGVTEYFWQQLVDDSSELVPALGVDQEKLFDVLEKIDKDPSLSNPAFSELDEVARELFFALVERKGYTPRELSG